MLAQYNGLGIYEPYLLPIAWYHAILQLFFGALILINSLTYKYRPESGITKDNSSSEKAVYDGDGYLDCTALALSTRWYRVHGLTYPLALGYFFVCICGDNTGSLVQIWGPVAHRVEAHLSV